MSDQLCQLAIQNSQWVAIVATHNVYQSLFCTGICEYPHTSYVQCQLLPMYSVSYFLYIHVHVHAGVNDSIMWQMRSYHCTCMWLRWFSHTHRHYSCCMRLEQQHPHKTMSPRTGTPPYILTCCPHYCVLWGDSSMWWESSNMYSVHVHVLGKPSLCFSVVSIKSRSSIRVWPCMQIQKVWVMWATFLLRLVKLYMYFKWVQVYRGLQVEGLQWSSRQSTLSEHYVHLTCNAL